MMKFQQHFSILLLMMMAATFAFHYQLSVVKEERIVLAAVSALLVTAQALKTQHLCT